MIVYFDTNIFRDLSEARVVGAEQKTDALASFVRNGKAIIAPSFEVLYELLSSPDVPDNIRLKNAQFYVDLVDWTYALKPSEQMIPDDISSLALKGCPSTPYRAVDKNRSGFVQSIRNGRNIFSRTEWAAIVHLSCQQNEKFVNSLFNHFVTKLPVGGKTKLRKFPAKTWDEWWTLNGLAELIANTLVVPVIGKQIQQYNPLSLPTVRAAVGYILHTWYCQIIHHAKLKPTTHCDFRNAVFAGGVGRIVTADKKLRKAINHIPNCNVKTWTLDEFIGKISIP